LAESKKNRKTWKWLTPKWVWIRSKYSATLVQNITLSRDRRIKIEQTNKPYSYMPSGFTGNGSKNCHAVEFEDHIQYKVNKTEKKGGKFINPWSSIPLAPSPPKRTTKQASILLI